MAPTSLRGLVTLQNSRAEEIKRSHARFEEGAPESLTRNIVEKRLTSIEKIWEEVRVTHAEILLRENSSADPYIVDGVFSRIGEAYESFQNDMLRILSRFDTSSINVTPHISRPGDNSDLNPRSAKLPKLDLPTFSGRYEDWENFCDLFTSLVNDNPHLGNVTKLQYLKSCLTGSAADLVKDVSTTNANYPSTWQALKVRFYNPRLTVNNLLTALMELTYLKRESAEELRAFSDEAQRIVRALTNLEMPVKHWGIWLVYVLASRLDPESRKLWEADLSVKDRQAVAKAAACSTDIDKLERFPSFDDFVEFLEQRSQALGMIAADTKNSKRSVLTHANSRANFKKVLHSSALPSTPRIGKSAFRKCPLCNRGHYIGTCPNYLAKSPYERRNEVRRLRLCFNCLGSHRFQNCQSNRRCTMCRDKHHSSIHNDPSKQVNSNANHDNKTDVSRAKDCVLPSSVSANTAGLSTSRHSVLLATAQVMILGPRGTQVRVRAMLDQGSEVSFVTESIAQLLELPKQRAKIKLKGIGASKAGTVHAITQVSLQSLYDTSFQLDIQALVLPRLTSQLPARKPMDCDLSLFNDINLADPHLLEPDSIDLILGADVYGEVLRTGLRRFPPSRLIAQDTALGWIVSGPSNSDMPRRAAPTSSIPNAVMHCAADDELQETLQRFWNVEEIGSSSKKLKPEDEACELLFSDKHFRTPDGRYTVRLPLKSQPPCSSLETRRIALNSLSNIHRRFSKDPKIAEAYRDFMKVYEELGHMERIPESQIDNPRAWYIPHHPIVLSTPTQWKFRVVFDASRRTSQQHCLNEFLMTGPALQSDISLVILNWRKYRYVFTADIVKMFRQIRVHPTDQDMQRILWTPAAEQHPVDYRLTTVTYGTACAPYLAIRTLAQLALDESHRFPLGSSCIQHNTYVDDIFAGADDLELAIKKRNELCELLHSAGIKLDKWAANQPELLPLRDQMYEADKHIVPNESVKTLGLRWNPATDTFGVSVNEVKPTSENPTKRSILSSISQLFDPLGWLAPITVIAKILMQDLWILKCDWDSPLPEEVNERWNYYRNSLASISNLPISRWVGSCPGSEGQIHGFADASSRAYAACVYLRLPNHDGPYRVSLLIAKTKVSPVKTMSIPNLELSAAALLVKLVCHIRTLPYLKAIPVYAWSDSQIVLAWLRKHPCHWKTFVANRVSFIQTELPSAEWKHVQSKENPADLATRGVKPSDLEQSDLWWNGPKWLTLSAEEWPKQPDIRQTFHTQGQSSDPEILTRFSTLTRLIRVVAYCRRPLLRLRQRKTGEFATASFLTTSELMGARIVITRLAQSQHFQSEIALLNTGGSLPKRNPLRKLTPFVGKEDGVLRVGGRLSHANLSREIRHPPILPYSSALSRLFVHHAHISCLHGGPTLTLSLLLRHAWILGKARLVKSEIRNCITCQRVKPRLASQLMGDLPKDRVTPLRPFKITGLDYAGPINVRTTKGRGHRSYKGYIALFVCFATRAIHLEAVSDLTTNSFLAAYRRFVGRRGICQRLYSDNGTTFHGAARELRAMFDAASEFYGEAATVLANEGTEWSFIPPNTPHCGGLWEAGVKSAKHHLKRMIGDHNLTFEELSTVLVEIEACLNSRPLHPLTNDLDDLSVLTPAHFLVGCSLGPLPDASVADVPENRLSRFQLLQRIRDHFWKRWSSEYLHHLQERTKWRNPSENFAVGQLVLVKDNRYPPSKWPLGRVIQVHPGPDGFVRVATVKMATTTLRRHVANLCPLLLPSS